MCDAGIDIQNIKSDILMIFCCVCVYVCVCECVFVCVCVCEYVCACEYAWVRVKPQLTFRISTVIFYCYSVARACMCVCVSVCVCHRVCAYVNTRVCV